MAISNTIDNSNQLVELCKQGNKKAQFELYNLYAKAMYNVSLRIVGQLDDAKDVLQDAFIDAFSKIESFRGESTFGAWLKTIVVNKALTRLKSSKIIFEDISETLSNSISDHSFDDFDDTEETILKVKKALQLLPDGFRIVLSLYLFDGYDHSEIGEILKINESTSRSQFLRGKNKLLEILNRT